MDSNRRTLLLIGILIIYFSSTILESSFKRGISPPLSIYNLDEPIAEIGDSTFTKNDVLTTVKIMSSAMFLATFISTQLKRGDP